jgi:hypothetical protein
MSKTKAPPTKKSTSSQPARPAKMTTGGKKGGAPLSAGPTRTPRTETTDPIWAAIEKHRAELAAYTIIADRPGDIPRGANDQVMAAGGPLVSTRPTTLAGAIAVLRYVRSQHHESELHEGAYPSYLPQEVDGEIWVYAFLENIADALTSGLDKIVAVTGAVERAEG